MAKLTIIKGNEFKLIARKKVDREDIFYDEYQHAVRMADEIIEAGISEKTNDQKSGREFSYHMEDFEFENNIIAFCGERGEGKSSAMMTLVNILCRYSRGKDCGDNDLFALCKNLKKAYFAEPVVIDPTLFDDVHNVLDIVIAKLFRNFSLKYKDSNQFTDKWMREGLVDQFQKVYRYLSLINNQTKMLDNEYDYEGNIGKLSKLGESTDLKKELKDLITKYLEVMEKYDNNYTEECGIRRLIIAIDDLDLCSINAYKMAEQIRKYLIIPNVIIIMAVKIDQLELCIEERNYYDFEMTAKIRDVEQVKWEVQNMAERYVSKLIPKARRIYLPKVQDFDKVEIEYMESPNGKPIWSSKDSSKMALAVLDLIYKKTGMKFLPEKRERSHLIPDNLRDMINQIVLLLDMEDANGSNEILKNNMLKFGRYFERQWVPRNMTLKMSQDIKAMERQDFYHLRSNTCWWLNKIFQNAEKKMIVQQTNPITIRSDRYNSFFDVISWFSLFESNVFGEDEERFACGFRALYTIKLNELLEKKENRSFFDFIDGYIWGPGFVNILPNIEYTQIDRSRFRINTWMVFNKITDEFFPNGKRLLPPEPGKPCKVSEIPANGDRKDYLQIWTILGMLCNINEILNYQEIYFTKGIFVFDNNNLTASVQVSLENYLVSLCDLNVIYDKVNMGILGIEREEFEQEVRNWEHYNADSIRCAREIAANIDLIMGIRDFWRQNASYKEKSRDSIERSCKLTDRFFENIEIYMGKQGMEGKKEDFKYFYFSDGTGEPEKRVDISQIYACLIEECIRNQQLIAEDKINKEGAKLMQEFRKKLTEIPKKWNRQNLTVSGFLRTATAENAKKNLEALAANIERYIGEKNEIPMSINVDFLCDFYSRIITLYLQDEKAELTEELREDYKEAVRKAGLLWPVITDQ